MAAVEPLTDLRRKVVQAGLRRDPYAPILLHAEQLGARMEVISQRLEAAGTPFDPRAELIMRATLRRAVGALGWRRIAVAFAAGLVVGGLGIGAAAYCYRGEAVLQRCVSLYPHNGDVCSALIR